MHSLPCSILIWQLTSPFKLPLHLNYFTLVEALLHTKNVIQNLVNTEMRMRQCMHGIRAQDLPARLCLAMLPGKDLLQGRAA